MTVRCKFGSMVQEAAERALPEWCNEKTCPTRSSAECFWTLKGIGIDLTPKAGIKEEEQPGTATPQSDTTLCHH